MRFWHVLVLASSMLVLAGQGCPLQIILDPPDPGPSDPVLLRSQIGRSPRGLAVSPDGSIVYAALLGDGAVAVIRAEDLAVLKTIPVGDAPKGIALTPDGAFLFVANSGSGDVSVIRTSDDAVVSTIATGREPSRVVTSADGQRAFVSAWPNSIHVLDVVNHTLLSSMTFSDFLGLAIQPDGSTLYAADFRANVLEINTADNSVRAAIPTGDTPDELVLSKGGGLLYVMHRMTNHLLTIRTSDRSVLGDTRVGGPVGRGTSLVVGSPGGLALRADGQRLFVTDHPSRGIAVVDTATYAVLGLVPLDGAMREVVANPERGVIYVSLTDKNQLVAISDTVY